MPKESRPRRGRCSNPRRSARRGTPRAPTPLAHHRKTCRTCRRSAPVLCGPNLPVPLTRCSSARPCLRPPIRLLQRATRRRIRCSGKGLLHIPSERPVHRFERIRDHMRHEVCIPVRRRADVCVAEHFLNDAQRYAFGDEKRRATVPQVVETKPSRLDWPALALAGGVRDTRALADRTPCCASGAASV